MKRLPGCPGVRKAELRARRDRVVATLLEREMTIDQYAEKLEIDQSMLRAWIKKAGHELSTWPQMPKRSRAEWDGIVADALEKRMPIQAYADKHGVTATALRLQLLKTGHQWIEWPRPVGGPAPKLRPRAVRPPLAEAC